MKTIFLALLIVLLVACAAPQASTSADEAAVRSVVEGFGQHLKNVSLLSDTASFQIIQEYQAYVAPELLALWATDPAHAPGRLTSSPWPDRIEIVSVESQGEGTYLVHGTVIEITSQEEVSGGIAAQYFVDITVKKIGESWLITSYMQTSNYQ
jgi:hypothetical protein